MHDLTFRRATEDDVRLVASILSEGALRKMELGDTIWGSEPFSDEETLGLIKTTPTYLVSTEVGVIATVALLWEDEAAWGKHPDDAGYIHKLVVKNSAHGQGIGEQIVAWAAAEVVNKGRPYLRLDCDDRNKKLCAYYERQGFKRVRLGQIDESDGYTPALYERPVLYT